MIQKIVYRAPGNYDPDKVSDETGLKCEDKSLAVQSQADEADINTIVRRFGLTGELPVDQRVALPEDVFFDDVNYRDCLDLVNAANRSFMTLPASVRSRFNNDAALFVDFASDPANLEECRKLGLAPAAPAAPAPQPGPASPA